MIPIKIQCGCGQRYAFDVEALGGRMPYNVACPVCGIDGTGAANDYLAQALTPPPAMATPAPSLAAPSAANGIPVRVSVTPPAAPSVHLAAASASATTQRGAVSHIPRIDRAQAEHEARAKVSWGDAPEAVLSYLMIQGLSFEEASALVKELFKERAATIRRNGFKKLAVGVGLMCVPVIALIGFLSMGYLPIKLFAVTIMIGLWGAWKFLKACFMILAPKSEPGDVAEQ
jgi:hypothetical protein